MSYIVNLWMGDTDFREVLAKKLNLEYVDGGYSKALYGRLLWKTDSVETAKAVAESKEVRNILEEIRKDTEIPLKVIAKGQAIYGVIDGNELEKYGHFSDWSAGEKVEEMWDEYIKREGREPDPIEFYRENFLEIHESMLDCVYVNPSVEEAFDALKSEFEEVAKKALKKNNKARRR